MIASNPLLHSHRVVQRAPDSDLCRVMGLCYIAFVVCLPPQVGARQGVAGVSLRVFSLSGTTLIFSPVLAVVSAEFVLGCLGAVLG